MKATDYRKITKALRKLGCTSRPGKGDHEVWTCGCGEGHSVALVRQKQISPGVMRQAVDRLTCLPKGWHL